MSKFSYSGVDARLERNIMGIFIRICVSLLLLRCSLIAGFRFRPKGAEQNDAETLNLADRIEDTFSHEYRRFLLTGSRSMPLKSLVRLMEFPYGLVRQEVEDIPENKQSITCLMCRSVVQTFIDLRRVDNYNDTQMREQAIDLCLTFNFQTEDVCKGLIEFNLAIILYILDHNPNIQARNVCGMVLQASSCGINDPYFEWSVEINQNPAKIWLTSDNEKPLKILHLTDIHYDPKYVVGSNAFCEEPLCCRGGDLCEPNDAAGQWSDYRSCDTPLHTVKGVLKHIKNTHKDIDLVYYTGDSVSHNVWETSIEGNIAVIKEIDELLKETFEDIPVYSILGNHETHPVNIYSPPEVTNSSLSTEWLFDHISKAWNPWIPDHQLSSVREGGFYSILVHPGFRVIGLNNNECYTYNWWLLHSPKMPAKQLQWLHDELLKAEAAGEKVHLLNHIPSGEGSCQKTCSREFRRIVERFKDTIAAQFNGHTHQEEFYVYYSREDNDKPINVAWNGGSLTSYSDVNPNYVIYHIDGSTLRVKDLESWSFNLTEANQSPDKEPEWKKAYTFSEEYETDDLSPAGLDELLHRFATDTRLLFRFYQNKYKRGDPYYSAGCSGACLKSTICELAITEPGDNVKCKYFADMLSPNLGESVDYFEEYGNELLGFSKILV